MEFALRLSLLGATRICRNLVCCLLVGMLWFPVAHGSFPAPVKWTNHGAISASNDCVRDPATSQCILFPTPLEAGLYNRENATFCGTAFYYLGTYPNELWRVGPFFVWPNCTGLQDHIWVRQNSASISCPDNATLSGTTCTCNEGFHEVGTSCQRGKNKNNGPACPSCGNPINPATGNKVERQEIYRGATGLEFSILYNSQEEDRASFGYRWRGSYDRRIRIVGENAVALRPDGKALPFAPSGGTWIAEPDTADRLTELPGGAGWTLYVAGSDETEGYDASGRLTSITARSGLTQTLVYSDGTKDANGGVYLSPEGAPTNSALPAGQLIRVTDPFGRSLSFAYYVSLHVGTVTRPGGGVYRFAYDLSSRLTSITFPDNGVRGFLYNEPAYTGGADLPYALTGVMDENGIRYATFGYDAQGRAVLTQLAGGNNSYALTYNPDGSAQVTDPLGTTRNYGFQNIFDALKSTGISGGPCSSCGPASQTFDANGNVQTRTDWNGNRTDYAYDQPRNLETSRAEGLTSAGATTPETRTISTQWDPVFRLPTGIAEPLRITTKAYDPDGSSCGARGALCSKSIQATTDANGSQGFGATPTGLPRTWSYTYNANGSVLTANGPRTNVSDITAYAYYANDDPDPGKRGNLHTVTNARGHVTEITAYNAHGQPLTIADPNGLTTTLGYDERLRLTSRTVGSEVTGYEYYPTGLLKKVTLPDGSFLFYTYDAAQRLTDINDSLGNLIHYGLDAMGNRTLEEVKDPLGALKQTRSRVFNSLNRLWKEIGAQSQTTEFGHDDQGNVTSINGPLAGTVDVTTQQFDALNRLKNLIDPDLGLTSYGYDGLDQLASVSDPRSLVTSYSYNGLGDLNEQVSPDTGTTANTYDSAGNLQTSTDAKDQVTTYAYDALNRVTSVTFHDGSRHDYLHDQGTNGIGRLTGIREYDPQSALVGFIDYGYDQKGRVVSDHQAVDLASTERTTSYQYDAFGRLSTITGPYTTPTSGGSVSYGYDAQGRISQISATYMSSRVTPPAMVTRTIVQDVTYHPFAGVKSFTFGDGRTYTRQYDQDGRIGSYTLGATQYTLGYDDASRINFINEVGNPANVNSYNHDVLDRLTQAILPATSYGYSYDATGNRLSRTAGAGSDTYVYPGTSNRLSSITPSSGPVRPYVHDPVGSVTDDGQIQYAYDARGRLIRASVGGCTVARYRVNPLGQRVRKQTWPVSPCQPALPADPAERDTVYTYDLQGRLIAETHSFAAYKRAFVYLYDMPVAMLFATDD